MGIYNSGPIDQSMTVGRYSSGGTLFAERRKFRSSNTWCKNDSAKVALIYGSTLGCACTVRCWCAPHWNPILHIIVQATSIRWNSNQTRIAKQQQQNSACQHQRQKWLSATAHAVPATRTSTLSQLWTERPYWIALANNLSSWPQTTVVF